MDRPSREACRLKNARVLKMDKTRNRDGPNTPLKRSPRPNWEMLTANSQSKSQQPSYTEDVSPYRAIRYATVPPSLPT